MQKDTFIKATRFQFYFIFKQKLSKENLTMKQEILYITLFPSRRQSFHIKIGKRYSILQYRIVLDGIYSIITQIKTF